MRRLETLAGTFFKALSLGFKIENDDDNWVYTEEPHTSRRQKILEAHPEIKQLMGYDPWIAVFVILEVIFQIIVTCAIAHYDPNYSTLLLLTYILGGTFNHSLGSAIHEIGHNLAFGHRFPKANRILSLVCNLPMGVPMAISYKKYHADHHRWLGHDTMDVDIPMRIESNLFRNPFTKIVWMLIHPLIHGLRPFLKSPRPATRWEITNFLTQGLFDIFVFKFLGVKSLIYMLMGTIFGLGLHPLAAHFISEHYLFTKGQATHSYYGPLNFILYNVGYHVEHHDFPYIPCRRLPKVREIAREFYDPLGYHTSWCKVVWDFIFDHDLGPHARGVTICNLSKPDLYNETLPNGDTSSYENRKTI